MTNCELLSPAGNPDALKTAVSAGADAVYLGGTLFSARASAGNFNNEELLWAVDFCHLRKVKVYVAVNILVSDREFEQLDRFIRYIDEIGVDGVIVQDIGVAEYIKNIAPSLPLHASTQMTVYDLSGALLLKDMGFKRVVLARELSFETIKEITEKSGIETEIFVHGAMCVCYSGQCLMSAMIGGRSGNRGKCAQPCRLLYSAGNTNGYLLSLKDMCLIKHLDKIKKCGVSSLKIEGRMKGPEYVGTVTSVYRKYIDSGAEISESDYEVLESIFYRGGFSDGYFKGKKGKEMFCHTKPDNPYLRQKGDYSPPENVKTTDMYLYFNGRIGENAVLRAVDEYGNCVRCISESVVEEAKTSSDIKSKINIALNKLGGTVFSVKSTEIDVDGNAFIPVSSVNAMRREVVSKLEERIVLSKRRPRSEIKLLAPVKVNKKTNFELSVSVSDKDQLKAMQTLGCKRIYAPIELNEYFNGGEVAVLPRITPENIEQLISEVSANEILVRSLGQLRAVIKNKKAFSTDFTLNVFNRFSADFLKKTGAKTVALSVELTLNQIKGISDIVDCEAVIYGRLPLMITENCMLKTSSGCTHGGFITDRTGERFLIKCLPECRNEIFNSKPVVMSDKLDDVKNAGIKYGRLSFTDETPKRCIEIYNSYIDGIPLTVDFTRGKFYKGV